MLALPEGRIIKFSCEVPRLIELALPEGNSMRFNLVVPKTILEAMPLGERVCGAAAVSPVP